jgi:hypothetical protein
MNPNLPWAIAVFDALAQLKLNGLRFQCQIRAKPVTPELAAAMKRAGCWLCYIGVESSSQRVLDGIAKGVTRCDIEAAARTLKQHGLRVYAFIMLYQAWESEGRLQTETTREVMGTLKFVLTMRLKGLVHFMSCGFTTAYPGADLHDICLRHHLGRPIPVRRGVVTPQDITMRLPGVPWWQMVLARTLGLLTQATLFLLAPEGGRRLTFGQNMHHAAYKLRYLLGLR